MFAAATPFFSVSQSSKAQECSLALGDKGNIVAKEIVFERMGADNKLHSVPLEEANEWVIIGYKNLNICEENEVVDVGENARAETSETELNDFGEMIDDIMYDPMHQEQMLSMDRGVFEREVDFYIALDEIKDVCKNDKLNCHVIVAYMRYLYETYESSRERYGFCYPGDVNQFDDANIISSQMHHTIADRLKARQGNQIILLPYSKGFHWSLIMIDINSKDVYYLDSAHRGPSGGTRALVNTGITSHLMVNGGKKIQLTWHYPKGPKQVGDFECGYFVMRFMRHFMKDPSKSLEEKMTKLKMKATYTKAELNEVRLEFIGYVERFL